MDVKLKSKQLKKIKLCLIFFSFILLFTCSKQHEVRFKLIYNSDSAEAIQFTSVTTPDSLFIFRAGASSPVLGSFSETEVGLRFTPVLAFQPGTRYQIRYKGQQLEFETKSSASPTPEVVAVYPSTDTVPENLLKFYVRFSQPMQRIGNSTDFIKLKKQGEDNFLDVFLPLETELWNEDHTQITLWLDPGRIKKDLIPNKERGNPLKKGQRYELHIDSSFESAEGMPLAAKKVKSFSVGKRDSEKPQISDWSFTAPKANTQDALLIDFKESLDAILLNEAFEILNAEGGVVAGVFTPGFFEKSLFFKPSTIWKKGYYNIKVQAKLEDLAANNLNRLFDEDIHNTKVNLELAPYYLLELSIE